MICKWRDAGVGRSGLHNGLSPIVNHHVLYGVGVATLNAAGLAGGFAAFPTILVVAPLTRRLVARLTRDEPDKPGRLHQQ